MTRWCPFLPKPESSGKIFINHLDNFVKASDEKNALFDEIYKPYKTRYWASVT